MRLTLDIIIITAKIAHRLVEPNLFKVNFHNRVFVNFFVKHLASIRLSRGSKDSENLDSRFFKGCPNILKMSRNAIDLKKM